MRPVAWSRAVAFAVVTLVMAAVAVCGRSVLAPLSRRAGARWAARSCQAWCRAGCALLGVRLEVRGRPPGGRFLAASNHLSYLDILVLGSLWPGVFVAKQEIASWPLFGVAARAAGTIFVRRESPREIVEVGRRMTAALEDGIPVTLFPEGRITDGATVLPFLPPLLASAARDEVPCHAITLSYAVDDPEVDPSTQIAWPTSDPLVPHVVGVAGMRDLVVRVDLDERAVATKDRKELARELHARVLSRFVPLERAQAAGDGTDDACAP